MHFDKGMIENWLDEAGKAASAKINKEPLTHEDLSVLTLRTMMQMILELGNDLRREIVVLREDMSKRFEQVDKRFEQMLGYTNERFEQVDKRFEQVDKRFEQVDKHFDNAMEFNRWAFSGLYALLVGLYAHLFFGVG